jgi:hypothetical protein
MLSEAYGGEILKKSSVFEWHKRFKEGWENMEDDERSDCQDLTQPMEFWKITESGAFRQSTEFIR